MDEIIVSRICGIVKAATWRIRTTEGKSAPGRRQVRLPENGKCRPVALGLLPAMSNNAFAKGSNTWDKICPKSDRVVQRRGTRALMSALVG